jgi:hypothetical protein
VEGSAFSSTIQAHKESGQPSKDSLEEHGFERSTIADILKEKGQKADGSWLWCTVDETVYDAVKHVRMNFMLEWNILNRLDHNNRTLCLFSFLIAQIAWFLLLITTMSTTL